MNIPTKLAPAIMLALGVGVPTTVLAFPFNSGDILTIDDGVNSFDSYGNPTNVASGSYFVMDISGDSNIGATEKTIIDGLGGITIGSASTPGDYDTWSFSNAVGQHYSNVVPVVGDTTSGLDFSGWTVFWNGGDIDMSETPWQPGNCTATHMGDASCTGFTFADGVASIQWSGVYGEQYHLWYSATVPTGGFTGTRYAVYLTGTVEQSGSNIPLNASANPISTTTGSAVSWIPILANEDGVVTCSIEPGDVPAHGTATVEADCTGGTYTHSGNTSTTDSFTFTVTDDFDTATATVNVSISTSGGGGGGTPGTLPDGAVVLQIDPGVQILLPDGSKDNVTEGSWFGMDTSTDSRIAGSEKTPLLPGPDGGINIGVTQAATGTHSGAPNGTENASIDAPWPFFGNTGMHFTASNAPAAINGNTANGIDLSGWRVTWNGIPAINMSTGAWTPGNCDALDITTCSFANGAAQFTWTDEDASGGISDGDSYRLIYAATVPEGDPSGFGRTKYLLNLVGTIAVIPPPTTSVGTLMDGDFGGTATNAYRTSALAADAGFSNVGGYFDFKVDCGGAGVGCTSDVAITLSTPIPAGAVLRKFGVTPGNPAGGWDTFDTTGGDALASAASVNGDCTAATYSAGLTAGHDCLRITQTDGGLNDTDPTAGIIGDPSGIAVPTTAPVAPDTSSGSSGCTLSNRPVSIGAAGDWLLVGAALVGLGLARRRRMF